MKYFNIKIYNQRDMFMQHCIRTLDFGTWNSCMLVEIFAIEFVVRSKLFFKSKGKRMDVERSVYSKVIIK